MGKEAVLEIIKRFKSELEAQSIDISKLILYGSYAAGTAKEESDIDLVIVSPSFRGKDYWERIDIITNAIYTVLEPIEAVAFTPEEWESGESFYNDYAKNGVLIN